MRLIFPHNRCYSALLTQYVQSECPKSGPDLPMTLSEALLKVADRQDLSRQEAVETMHAVMSGEGTPAQVAALLTALRMKGETVEEITGFAETMRAMATPIRASRRPLVDTCGTGGDRSGTFNISTTAAFVVAGAGVAVAKHGNRSASSQCGSADVLEALGVRIDASPETVAACIDEIGIGFLFARSLHSAMKHVAPIRSELGFRTVFNLLGPLTNPAGADGQVMGLFDAARIESIASVLASLGVRHAFVVASADGLDEISLSGPSHIAEARHGTVTRYEITPGQFGLASAPIAAIRGGATEENARLLRQVLDGRAGPHRDIVLLNAAPALVAGGAAATFEEGLLRAAESIDSGAAAQKLEALREASNA